MKILLIRHAESEHNILGLWAGVTDSALTIHGVLQAKRLGEHLAERNLHFTQIYASDLQRAFMTAEAIARAQQLTLTDEHVPAVIQSTLLREQNLGSYELTSFGRTKSGGNDTRGTGKAPNPDEPTFEEKESLETMSQRADTFFADSILPLLSIDLDDRQTVAVVSHGIFLSTLWRKISHGFQPSAISFGPDVAALDIGWWSPRWSNTGYLEVDLVPQNDILNLPREALSESSLRLGHMVHVTRADCKDHLRNLKRTRGIGSETFDPKQKNIEGFFKKAKVEIAVARSDPKQQTSPEVTPTGTSNQAKAKW